MTGRMIIAIIAAVIISLGIQNLVLPKISSDSIQRETAYDRVIRTNTLRCAYAVLPPFLGKDPNNGKLSGLMPSLMAEFEKASGIKVEWGPEIDWSDVAVTLQSGKADAFCTSMAATPKRGRVIANSIPLFYGVLTAFVRPNDTRFDNNPERINQPDVRLSVNEGDLSEECAQRIFPQAQRVYKGVLGGEDALFLNVATNKADVVLSSPSNLSIFNKNSPEMALRKVEFQRILAFFPSVIGVDIREQTLLPVINATLHNLIDNGVVERALRANLGTDYGSSYFPAKPQLN